MAVTPRTMLEKIWQRHEILTGTATTPAVLRIDLPLGQLRRLARCRSELPLQLERMWRTLLGVAMATGRISTAGAAFVWKWRLHFAAALTGLAVTCLAVGLIDWVQAPMTASAPAIPLSAVPKSPAAAGDFESLVRRCAPGVAPNTMLAIMHTESSFNPMALHVNGNTLLQHAPRSLTEAIQWSTWLVQHGNSVDMGLMQINSRNLARLKMSVADAFDPCRNVHAAGIILSEQYQLAAHFRDSSAQALLAAISAYNTGNFRDGLRNGYVSKVLQNAAAR